MNDMTKEQEQPAGDDGNPKFGRLLIVLLGAVILVVAITLISESMYS